VQAAEDLATARRLVDDGESPPRLAAFLAHLAAEKALKGALIARGIATRKIHEGVSHKHWPRAVTHSANTSVGTTANSSSSAARSSKLASDLRIGAFSRTAGTVLGGVSNSLFSMSQVNGERAAQTMHFQCTDQAFPAH